MHARVQQLIERIDALELRQRIMLLVAILALIFLLVDSLTIQPAIKQQQVQRQAITDWELKLDVLRERSGTLPDHPNNTGSTRHADMQAQLDALNAQIEERIGGLLAPEQAVEVLKQVLEQEQGLSLIEVNAGNERLTDTDLSTADEVKDMGINRYQMQLQLEGSYLATLRYLRALEELPWKFFWEGLNYEVTEYPRARVTIDLYTLGLAGGA